MAQLSREDTIPGEMKLDRQSNQTIKKIQRKLFRYSPNWGAMEFYNINIKQKVNILSNIVIILNSHMKDIKILLNSKQKVCFFLGNCQYLPNQTEFCILSSQVWKLIFM